MRTPRQTGFTLIEVLVAFTILVASVSVAVVVFGQGLQVAATADDYARAIAVAENRLAEVGAAETLEAGENGGAAAEDMAWNVQVAPGFLGEGGTEGKPDFFRIAVTVAWGRDEKPRSLTLHSLYIPPRPRQTTEEDEADESATDGDDTGVDDMPAEEGGLSDE